MALYFGTDGIRGIACRDLSPEMAQKLGNALSQIVSGAKILIGRDTRCSGPLLSSAFTTGAILGGATIIDVGITPTAGVAFLTKQIGADYGVVVSASHNPPEYNGLKVFDKNGKKLNDIEEEKLEDFFASIKIAQNEKLGTYFSKPNLTKKYCKHLISSSSIPFNGLKITLDCANGAAYKIAPEVFKSLGATIYLTACSNNGAKINDGCGSLNIENLVSKVKESGSDVGFAFDGDSDRIIAVDKNLSVMDGDKIIYILACELKSKGMLKNNTVVGTSHTNSGICGALEKHKINMVRTDIGDKYVIEAMENMNLNLGGEQSGHIILSDFATTGDGVLTAIKLTETISNNNKTLSELFDAPLFPQENRTYKTSDKLRLMNSETINSAIKESLNELPLPSRILVRASGTEPKIRIMVESTTEKDAKTHADKLLNIIQKVDHHEQ